MDLNELKMPLEGYLHKFTNLMKGYQPRWFVLDPQNGMLEYYMTQEEFKEKIKPKNAIYLGEAVILPSEEDSYTFVLAVGGREVYRIKATNAKERQVWVNRLRSTAEHHHQISNKAISDKNSSTTSINLISPAQTTKGSAIKPSNTNVEITNNATNPVPSTNSSADFFSTLMSTFDHGNFLMNNFNTNINNNFSDNNYNNNNTNNPATKKYTHVTQSKSQDQLAISNSYNFINGDPSLTCFAKNSGKIYAPSHGTMQQKDSHFKTVNEVLRLTEKHFKDMRDIIEVLPKSPINKMNPLKSHTVSTNNNIPSTNLQHQRNDTLTNIDKVVERSSYINGFNCNGETFSDAVSFPLTKDNSADDTHMCDRTIWGTSLDPDLLLLKATGLSTLNSLQACLSILEHQYTGTTVQHHLSNEPPYLNNVVGTARFTFSPATIPCSGISLLPPTAVFSSTNPNPSSCDSKSQNSFHGSFGKVKDNGPAANFDAK